MVEWFPRMPVVEVVGGVVAVEHRPSVPVLVQGRPSIDLVTHVGEDEIVLQLIMNRRQIGAASAIRRVLVNLPTKLVRFVPIPDIRCRRKVIAKVP